MESLETLLEKIVTIRFQKRMFILSSINEIGIEIFQLTQFPSFLLMQNKRRFKC